MCPKGRKSVRSVSPYYSVELSLGEVSVSAFDLINPRSEIDLSGPGSRGHLLAQRVVVSPPHAGRPKTVTFTCS